MSRYLINYSYIGTYFRGAQKLSPRNSTLVTWTTIQECIEAALKTLRPVTPPVLVLSSRTDAGVHALDSTAHFDLQKRNGFFDCDYLTQRLNNLFIKKNLAIVIKNTRRVPDEFSARFSALSRSYLYRLAVPKAGVFQDNLDVFNFFPIEEWGRCYLFNAHNYDIEKFKEAVKLFEGIHDFRTFRKTTENNDAKESVRTVYSITVSKGSPFITSYNSNKVDKFEFWDINLRGKSFLHNQVRRMIGASNYVAIGKLSLKDIRIMLQVPSKHNWNPVIHPVPAHGLYLTNVEYNPKDLIIEKGL